jgi:hypothetical protein
VFQTDPAFFSQNPGANLSSGILPKESGQIYTRAASLTGRRRRPPIVALFFKSPGDFAATKSLENVITSARFRPR